MWGVKYPYIILSESSALIETMCVKKICHLQNQCLLPRKGSHICHNKGVASQMWHPACLKKVRGDVAHSLYSVKAAKPKLVYNGFCQCCTLDFNLQYHFLLIFGASIIKVLVNETASFFSELMWYNTIIKSLLTKVFKNIRRNWIFVSTSCIKLCEMLVVNMLKKHPKKNTFI